MQTVFDRSFGSSWLRVGSRIRGGTREPVFESIMLEPDLQIGPESLPGCSLAALRDRSATNMNQTSVCISIITSESVVYRSALPGLG